MKQKARKTDNEAEGDIIQLELEGFSPQAEDRDGIIQLLNQLMPKDSNLHLGGIADFIIAQSTVGTVVKNCSEEDEADANDDDDNIVFSLTTVISLCEATVSRSSTVSDLRNFLKTFASRAESTHPDTKALLNIINGTSTEKPALLLNERFVNLPPSTAAQAVAALPEEVKSLPEAEQPTHLIVLTRALKAEGSTDLVYIQPEMELVRKASVAAIEIDVVNKAAEDATEKITYVIMAIDFSRLPEVLDMLANMP